MGVANGTGEAASGPRMRRHRVKRILDRNAPEFQSLGMFNVRHYHQSTSLFWKDIYHVVIHMPLWGLLLVFVISYLISWLIFAGFWYSISEPCDIGLESFRAAFYLSIETQMTIGYGVP